MCHFVDNKYIFRKLHKDESKSTTGIGAGGKM